MKRKKTTKDFRISCRLTESEYNLFISTMQKQDKTISELLVTLISSLKQEEK